MDPRNWNFIRSAGMAFLLCVTSIAVSGYSVVQAANYHSQSSNGNHLSYDDRQAMAYQEMRDAIRKSDQIAFKKAFIAYRNYGGQLNSNSKYYTSILAYAQSRNAKWAFDVVYRKDGGVHWKEVNSKPNNNAIQTPSVVVSTCTAEDRKAIFNSVNIQSPYVFDTNAATMLFVVRESPKCNSSLKISAPIGWSLKNTRISFSSSAGRQTKHTVLFPPKSPIIDGNPKLVVSDSYGNSQDVKIRIRDGLYEFRGAAVSNAEVMEAMAAGASVGAASREADCVETMVFQNVAGDPKGTLDDLKRLKGQGYNFSGASCVSHRPKYLITKVITASNRNADYRSTEDTPNTPLQYLIDNGVSVDVAEPHFFKKNVAYSPLINAVRYYRPYRDFKSLIDAKASVTATATMEVVEQNNVPGASTIKDATILQWLDNINSASVNHWTEDEKADIRKLIEDAISPPAPAKPIIKIVATHGEGQVVNLVAVRLDKEPKASTVHIGIDDQYAISRIVSTPSLLVFTKDNWNVWQVAEIKYISTEGSSGSLEDVEIVAQVMGLNSQSVKVDAAGGTAPADCNSRNDCEEITHQIAGSYVGGVGDKSHIGFQYRSGLSNAWKYMGRGGASDGGDYDYHGVHKSGGLLKSDRVAIKCDGDNDCGQSLMMICVDIVNGKQRMVGYADKTSSTGYDAVFTGKHYQDSNTRSCEVWSPKPFTMYLLEAASTSTTQS